METTSNETHVPAAPENSASAASVIRKVLRHPFLHLWLLVFFCLSIKEFYPFSNFPMYSDPDETENYLVVGQVTPEEENGWKPLPVRELTGITAPKVKKMFKSRRDAYCDEVDKDSDELSEAELAAIGQDLLNYLREQALARTDGKEPLPDQLVLVDYWIIYEDGGGYSETPTIITKESAPGVSATN